MKTKLKRLISFVLTVALLLSLAAPALAANDNAADLPIVYVMGRNKSLYSADGTRLYPYEKTTKEHIQDAVDPVTDALKKALVTGNWDLYYDSIYDAVAPIYKDVIADNNGDVPETDYIEWDSYVTAKTSGFGLNDYVFEYDWRLDPDVVAQKLHAYVAEIKAKTGKDKVNFIGRCFGSNIVAAYITRYGSEDVAHTLFAASSAKGVSFIGALFAGKVEINPEALDKYLTYSETLDNSEESELIRVFVSLLRQVYVLDIGTDVANSICQKILENVLPRILRSSYGTFASFWSMVGEEYFEDAKKFVFSGYEEEYAGLIEKIDNYQYNVMQNLEETITTLENEGMRYSNISKYNLQLPPIYKNSDEQGDATGSLYCESFGATSAKFGKTLSASYLAQAKENGTFMYISADEKVDASTCLSPDTTWFISNLSHDGYPDSIRALMLKIFKSEKQLTVWDDENYPQFLVYNSENGSLSPCTEKDANDSKWSDNFMTVFIRFIKNLIKYFAALIKGTAKQETGA